MNYTFSQFRSYTYVIIKRWLDPSGARDAPRRKYYNIVYEYIHLYYYYIIPFCRVSKGKLYADRGRKSVVYVIGYYYY